jgi:hypothetical protein
MYFEKLISLSGKKTISEIFPDFSLFVYGGVNFAPYKNVFNKLIGKKHRQYRVLSCLRRLFCLSRFSKKRRAFDATKLRDFL